MRRLTLMAASLLLALGAARLLSGSAGATAFFWRDGLLLATIATLIFAWQARAPLDLYPTGVTYRWPAAGRALWGGGIISLLAGAALFAVGAPGSFLTALRLALVSIGLVLVPVGAFWRGPLRDFAPLSHRWERDASGQFVRVDLQADAPMVRSTPQVGYLSGSAVFVGVTALLLLGAFLGLRSLHALPATCLQVECFDALMLSGTVERTAATRLDPFLAVASLIMAIVDDPVLSLRLAALCFSMAMLWVVYLMLRRLVIPESALLGLWLLVLSGWQTQQGRLAGSDMASAFLLAASLWALFHALASRDRRWWVATGLLLGLFSTSVPAFTVTVWGWTLLVVFSVSVRRRHFFSPSLLLLVSAISVSMPAYVLYLWPQFGAQAQGGGPIGSGLMVENDWHALLTGASTRNGLILALALLGGGYLLRFAARPAMAAILGALLSLALGLVWRGGLGDGSALLSGWPLMPFAILVAVLAGDQLLRGLVEPWRRVVRPEYMIVAVYLVVAFAGVRSMAQQPAALSAPVEGGAEQAMIAYLVEQTAAQDAATLTNYVPPALVENPAFQIVGRDWLEAGQVRPMASIEEALFSGDRAPGQRFLLPGVDQIALDLLTTLFPNSSVEAHMSEEQGHLLFHTVTISPEDRAWPGLQGIYRQDGPNPETVLERRDSTLSFDWSRPFDPQPPFVTTWQGSLLISEAGEYVFGVDGAQNGDADFTLLLDNEIVLASALDLVEQRKLLAQGIYRLDVRYTSGERAAPLVLHWQRPDGSRETIPSESFVSRPLPNLGLLGTYFAGRDFQAPAVRVRKDLRFDRPPDGLEEYSVRWSGHLAVGRAGEYVLATVDEGDSWLHLDGRLLVDNSGDAPGEELQDYAEGARYLERGWHEIEISYVPETSMSTLQLLWQPAGGASGRLPVVALSPATGEVNPTDLPLPPPPPLSDSRLGTDDFALSQPPRLRATEVGSPPLDLPVLPLEMAWRSQGGCGDGDGQLSWPHGVAMDTGADRIYVADSGNRRVAIFDFTGSWHGVIESDTFEEPHDVDVSPDGFVYLLDAVGDPLQRIDPAGGMVEPVAIEASFYRPRGLSASKLGVIAVADTGGGRVVLLTPDGSLLAEFGGADSAMGPGQPVDVALSDRALWALTAEDGRLWDLNSEGSLTAVQRTTTLDGPQLAVLEDGTLFLTDPERRSLSQHRADGRPVARYEWEGVLDRPTGIDASVIGGDLYLAVIDTDRCTLSLWRGAVAEARPSQLFPRHLPGSCTQDDLSAEQLPGRSGSQFLDRSE